MYQTQKAKVKKEPFLVTAFGLLVVLYVAHKLLPIVGLYMPSVAYLGCFALIAGLLVTSTRKLHGSSEFTRLVLVFSLSIFGLLFSASEGTMTVVMNLYGELQIFLYGWITLWYIKREDGEKARKLFVIIAVFYAITVVTTLLGNMTHIGASRYLATVGTDDPTYRLYTGQNIGSFSFIYELTLILPLLVYAIKFKKVKRYLGIIALAVSGFAILQTEYTTALMLFAATASLLFFKKLTVKKIAVILVIFLVIAAFASTLIAPVFDMLSENIPSETLSARFNYIATTLRGEKVEDTEDSGDRMTLYKKAIDTILETKFMGNWTGKGGSGHSLMLDTVVKYGIIGIIVLTITYVSIYKYALYPNRKKEYFPYLVWIYILAIFLAVINPKTNLFIFICVIPLFARIIDDMKKGEQYEIAVDSE